jgi:type IV pilus assembly protein PilV
MRTIMRKGARRIRGISMVEAMVALVVISVGMLGIAGLYLSSLQAGRSANLRMRAVNLASEMADRIRANRDGKATYNLANGTTPTAVNCSAGDCTPQQLAQSDQNIWVTAIKDTRLGLPGANAGGAITFTENAGAIPDRYEIIVTWRESGSDVDTSYRLVMEL